jgi:hypothetical protein
MQNQNGLGRTLAGSVGIGFGGGFFGRSLAIHQYSTRQRFDELSVVETAAIVPESMLQSPLLRGEFAANEKKQ